LEKKSRRTKEADGIEKQIQQVGHIIVSKATKRNEYVLGT
jgi:hypothetical protein